MAISMIRIPRYETSRDQHHEPDEASRTLLVERTQSWMNGFGKLRRCMERDTAVYPLLRAL